MSQFSDRELGMDQPISRRDFLNGMAVGIGVLGGSEAIHGQTALTYPPVRTGMRGSHPGSFEAVHQLRDGTFWKNAGAPKDTHEVYDFVVVGAGISGLSAAYFLRKRAGSSTRILILENHDDFGGHAKRNEFHLGGRMLLSNGGTVSIDSPTPYSAEADSLLKELGIDPPALAQKYRGRGAGAAAGANALGLQGSFFFNKEQWGEDRLVVGSPGRGRAGRGGSSSTNSLKDWLARTPFSEQVQKDIVRIEEENIDYLSGLSSSEKKDRLSRMSYKDFLLNIAKVDPGVIPYYQTRTQGEWGVGIDAEPALDCWGQRMPGFQGLNLDPGVISNMSYTAAGYAVGRSYSFHFPDGNASIARLLVRKLIPEAVPGETVEDIVTAKVDYGALDHASSPVRIRLNSPAVRARHLGDPTSAKEVEVAYVQGKQVSTVRARGVVMACWNTVVPFLCPELPEKQKEAMHYLVKVPLVYTRVGIRNWTSFTKLGISGASSPMMYHTGVNLSNGMDMGDYKGTVTSPDEPTLLTMTRTPCKPGLPVREQHKAGRAELLATSFQDAERKIRDQLVRILAKGGFDPARDIAAITINRWAHGYGYEYNPLFDPLPWPPGQAPHEIGRRRFGRITIANSDSGATAYTDVAIDQAYRAVGELVGDRAG